MTTNFAAKLDALEIGTLNPGDFSHADHIGVAWEALSRYEFFDAAQRYATGLRRLTARAGVPEKYNATLTLSALSLIGERMQADPCDSAAEFVARHGGTFTAAFLGAQYPASRLRSDIARRTPLLPHDQFARVHAPAV